MARRRRQHTIPTPPPRLAGSPRLVTVDEAIAYSKLSRSRLFVLLKGPSPQVRSVKPGRTRLVDLDSLDKYLKDLVLAC